ncbi:MAG: 50S ribosomal protein L3 [Muribaculaceae bacterium]|nr:50S ribosomal protein L3 [Muribaculaceae bacterium]
MQATHTQITIWETVFSSVKHLIGLIIPATKITKKTGKAKTNRRFSSDTTFSHSFFNSELTEITGKTEGTGTDGIGIRFAIKKQKSRDMMSIGTYMFCV